MLAWRIQHMYSTRTSVQEVLGDLELNSLTCVNVDI